MASEWHYSINGRKHGPVSSKELADLARDGKLTPTDLVQKEGMSEWQPASRVKGLFPTAPPAAQPPVLPPPPAAEPPSVAGAAKNLLGALADAAKRAGTKVAEAAKQPPPKARAKPVDQDGPETEEESSDATPDQSASPKVSRRTMVVAGSAGGVLLLSCVVCGVIGAVASRGVRPTPGSDTAGSDTGGSDTGGERELRAFADIPPPVQAAVNGGKVAWELTGWHDENDGYLKQSLYVILDNGSLSALHPKSHHKKGPAGYMGNRGKDREIIDWSDLAIDLLPTEKQKLEWHWRWQPAGENRYTLTFETKVAVDISDSTTRKVANIVIDPRVGEGYWQGEKHLHTQFKGRMAKYDDERETKPLSGGSVLPVKPK